MTDLVLALCYGAFAGLMIPLGGYLASIERIQPRWLEQEVRHSVMAFGGGILISAVGFVLVPEGLALLPLWVGVAAFFLGGGLFALAERLRRSRAGQNAQFLAMLTDFVPEAISLGAIMASRSSEAALLALLIGAQNLPEAFNAWRELKDRGHHGRRHMMRVFFGLAAIGPVAVVSGYLFLSNLPAVTGALMMAAAGGILYLMFQDIAVKAHLKNRQAPSLAALSGFAFGMICNAVVGGG
ncbi:ZIP family metal transporter [Alexandriicola marinus]|uniref:ZIP family metal transporter n=1 Tax=Alexandriicola marinus TaxID=2081710 RepID=UPI001F0C1BE2|nr:divalent cation transporter [Alexandriicola marinus]